MQNLFINIRCFMETIIFQLLSCLYLYDSSMPVPVCIRKQSRSTDFWRLALIYCAVGLPTSGAEIPCRRSTDFWRRREVCAKSVDRLLASKVLISKYLEHISSQLTKSGIAIFIYNTIKNYKQKILISLSCSSSKSSIFMYSN